MRGDQPGARRRAVPGDAHRRPRRRDLDPGRRQGQPGRPLHVARQGRTPARRQGGRRRGGHRRRRRGERRAPDSDRRARPPRGRGAGHRLRDRRQLRRPVGAAVRRSRRGERAALVGRALLHRHRPDRGRASDAAGDARPRRLHLLQGGGRRPGDGRLRAEGQAVERRPDPRDLPLRAARRGLGPVRAAHDRGDASHSLPRDGAGQDAAQRPGELHPRRQLHPRRGARARPLLRRRRLQLRRHRQLGRRRAAARRMDRRRQPAERSLGRRHPPLRPVHGQPQAALRAHRRDPRPALCDALAAPGARDGAAAAHLAALRPARRPRRGVRREERLGARQLLRSRRCRQAAGRGPDPASAHPRQAALAGRRDRRAAGDARGGGALRPDLVRQAAAFGPRRPRGARAALRQRDRRRPGAHGLHRAAERARRLRERPDDHPARSRELPPRHRLGAADPRRRLDRPAHRRQRIGDAWSTSAP